MLILAENKSYLLKRWLDLPSLQIWLWPDNRLYCLQDDGARGGEESLLLLKFPD